MLDYDLPEVSVVACNWNNTPLLKVFINGLLNSLTVKTAIFINLNEASQESVDFLNEKEIKFVANEANLGTVAVDQLTHLVKSKWIITINDDEIPFIGWQDDLLSLAINCWPCCPSVTCVEPEFTGNSMVVANDCGHILEKDTPLKFNLACESGIFARHDRFGYQHPTLYITDIWKSLGGYSCGLPFDHFGLAGYCADDYFNYKMRQFLGERCDFVVSGRSFCYHQVSNTTKRLAPEIKNFDAHSKFVQLTGISTQQFRESIRWGKLLS